MQFRTSFGSGIISCAELIIDHAGGDKVCNYTAIHRLGAKTTCKDSENEFDTIWFDNISRLRMMKVNTSIEVKSRKVHHRPLIR